MKNIRIIIIFSVIIAVLFFLVGFILVKTGVLDENVYTNIAAIVGGIASILGLLGFLIPTVSKNDIEKVGVEYLEDVVEAAKKLEVKEIELKDKEDQLSNKEKELKKLEIQKQEIEVLIKKASLRIFLQDQLERNQNRISSIIEKNEELKSLLEERNLLFRKEIGLKYEIEKDPNVDALEEIMAAIKLYRRNMDRGIELEFDPVKIIYKGIKNALKI